jgi:hypothetical protein
MRADRLEFGKVAARDFRERVPVGAVDRPHPAQVMIELAAVEEVGEGELFEARQTPGRCPIDRGRSSTRPPGTAS